MSKKKSSGENNSSKFYLPSFQLQEEVSIKACAGLKGVVVGICLNESNMYTYLVRYWNEGQRKELWLSRYEIESKSDVENKPGFRGVRIHNQFEAYQDETVLHDEETGESVVIGSGWYIFFCGQKIELSPKIKIVKVLFEGKNNIPVRAMVEL